MDRLLSVVVCTRNRERLLGECVESLLQQTASESQYEIVLVDNASTDGTPALVNDLASRHDHLIAVREPETGLSVARNTGLASSSGAWVAYLDDDGVAHPDWVARILEHVHEARFDAIGGLYLPRFESEPPAWYLERYNSNGWMLREGEPVYEIGVGDAHFSGGNCAYRRAALEDVGGFSVDLGMCGDRVAYSEEVEIQNRLLAGGYRLGFDARLRMDHDTPRYKQRLGWFIHQSFVKGRDQVRVDQQRLSSRWSRFVQACVRGAVGAARAEVVAIVRACRGLRDGSHRWQNVVIDLSEPIVHYAGKLYGLVIVR